MDKDRFNSKYSKLTSSANQKDLAIVIVVTPLSWWRYRDLFSI